MRQNHSIYVLLIMIFSCLKIFGCGNPADTVVDVMSPSVVDDDPPPETVSNPGSIEILITTPPEIVDPEPDTVLPIFETVREAYLDEEVQAKIQDTLDWVDENCGKTVLDELPALIQILFTDADDRQEFIHRIMTDFEFWTFRDESTHQVDGTTYFLLQFIVDYDEATKAENCE